MEPIDDVTRGASGELNKLHSRPAPERRSFSRLLIELVQVGGADETDKIICEKVLEIASGAKEHWARVSALIPKGEFYRSVFVPPLWSKMMEMDDRELKRVDTNSP